MDGRKMSKDEKDVFMKKNLSIRVGSNGRNHWVASSAHHNHPK
jgi:hypothetical protein